MVLKETDPDKEPGRDYKQIGILTTVPTMLLVGPILGLFAGQWADDKFGTGPYLTVVGVVLGLASAGLESYNLIKKAQEAERREEDSE